MVTPADKARELRLKRLTITLEQRLENPAAALEVLISEAAAGEAQTNLWEDLHAAALRDQMEEAVAAAYVKVASTQRLNRLAREAQAQVLLHAADFFQGVMGDAATAENFLERIQHLVPGHPEAFTRLERRLESLADGRRVVELYAIVAAVPPIAPATLATKALNKILVLPARTPLSDDACKQLVALVPTNPKLLTALEAHCRSTKRFRLACELIEKVLLQADLAEEIALGHRRRLVELYMGEADLPALAMPHVEALLGQDPGDTVMRKIAERLLSTREVAARAAAALAKARREARF